MKRIIPLLLTGLCLTGCSALIPSERKTNESVKAAGELSATHSTEVRKAGQVPPVNIRASGFGRADVKIEGGKGQTEIHENDTQVASGTDALLGSSSTKTSFVVLCAIGLAVAVGVVFLIKYLRKSSPAVDAGFQMADDMLRRQIERHRAQALTSIDHGAIAKSMAEVAHLEAERGKLAAQSTAAK